MRENHDLPLEIVIQERLVALRSIFREYPHSLGNVMGETRRISRLCINLFELGVPDSAGARLVRLLAEARTPNRALPESIAALDRKFTFVTIWRTR